MPTSKVHPARSVVARRDGVQLHEGVRQEAGRGEGAETSNSPSAGKVRLGRRIPR
jgi:hypothetical protein